MKRALLFFGASLFACAAIARPGRPLAPASRQNMCERMKQAGRLG